jgi:hypothetical protein
MGFPPYIVSCHLTIFVTNITTTGGKVGQPDLFPSIYYGDALAKCECHQPILYEVIVTILLE